MIQIKMYNRAYSQNRPASPRLIDREISVEIAVDQAREFRPDPAVFPPGSRVFLPHLKGKELSEQVKSATLLKEQGYVPVPHLGARNFDSVQEYINQIDAFTRAGICEALFLGGNPLKASGPLSNAMQLLRHPVLSSSSITTVHIGGYPEGHPAISEAALDEAVRFKLDHCAARSLRATIVSQFAFDGGIIGKWARRMQSYYPGVPIRVGLAGVASLANLIKFSMMCGIGPSLAALRGRSASLVNILSETDPSDVIRDIESEYQATPGELDIHFFPFGGWQKTLEWVAIVRNS